MDNIRVSIITMSLTDLCLEEARIDDLMERADKSDNMELYASLDKELEQVVAEIVKRGGTA